MFVIRVLFNLAGSSRSLREFALGLRYVEQASSSLNMDRFAV